MTRAFPQGQANFHTDRHRARTHLCSWKSLQNFYVTERNSDASECLDLPGENVRGKETERNREGGFIGMRGKKDG